MALTALILAIVTLAIQAITTIWHHRDRHPATRDQHAQLIAGHLETRLAGLLTQLHERQQP